MQLQEDLIADISIAREKFFGCFGKMLMPSAATVQALLREIPASTLITTALLQEELARRHHVEVTCPVATRTALRSIANDPGNETACWRVIKKNGELLSYFPGGAAGQAAKLENEGFQIDSAGKVPKVSNFMANLVRFG